MINSSAIKASWGNYFREGGLGPADVMRGLIIPSATDAEWAGRVVPTEDTQARKMKISLSSVLQPWQKGASPAGDMSMEPFTKDLSLVKYETDIDPYRIMQSAAEFMASDTNDASQWPIAKVVVQMMMEKGREDWDLHAVMKGVYSAPTAGTAGPPQNSHNGILKQIIDDVAASKITPVSGPANWSTDPQTCLAELEQFIADVKAVSTFTSNLVDNYIDKIFMDKALAQRIYKGIYKEYNVNYNATGDDVKSAPLKFVLPFTNNITVVGLNSMSGRKRVIMTPAVNRFAQIKRPKSEAAAELFQTEPREFIAHCDFYKQTSYWDPSLVLINDQA